MKNKFCIFILTHGRPDNVKTYEILRKHGYKGDIFLLIDNEDKTADAYFEKYGTEVIMFDKSKYDNDVDTGDTILHRKSIVYARHASYEIAEIMGYDYFGQFDDDYTSFMYRTPELSKTINDLNAVFDIMIEFFKSTPIKTICMSQGGDHIGGYNPEIKLKRKAMNSFICSSDRKINFAGRLNDDVTAYVRYGAMGDLFFTLMNIQLVQTNTQQDSGGMSDVYLDTGTYSKSFYSLIYSPSNIKIRLIGVSRRRLHHNIKWNNAVPKIIDEKYKKQ